jgi:mRNA interferase MazF
MLRGEIHLVDLEPARPGEANKSRPAILVSNDAQNTRAAVAGRGSVTVVPLTSNTDRIYPFQILVPAADSGIPVDSKAQAEQIRTIAISRVGPRLGRLTAELSDRLDAALRLHLDV